MIATWTYFILRILLKWSIKEKDYLAPILVSRDGFVLDGAHRVENARLLNIQVPAIVIDAEVIYLDPYKLITYLDQEK